MKLKKKMALGILALTSSQTVIAGEVSEQVKEYFTTNYAEECFANPFQDGEAYTPTLLYTGSEWPKISQFTCNSGAYSYTHVYLKSEAIGTIKPLQFTRFDLNENGENKGILATEFLTNSQYDKEKGMIFEFSKWRGIGDASYYSEFKFDKSTNWHPILTKAEVDATYDQQINPKVIYDANCAD